MGLKYPRSAWVFDRSETSLFRGGGVFVPFYPKTPDAKANYFTPIAHYKKVYSQKCVL